MFIYLSSFTNLQSIYGHNARSFSFFFIGEIIIIFFLLHFCLARVEIKNVGESAVFFSPPHLIMINIISERVAGFWVRLDVPLNLDFTLGWCSTETKSDVLETTRQFIDSWQN